jgi:hypothetical protein
VEEDESFRPLNRINLNRTKQWMRNVPAGWVKAIDESKYILQLPLPLGQRQKERRPSSFDALFPSTAVTSNLSAPFRNG